jgi:hypothetical protein
MLQCLRLKMSLLVSYSMMSVQETNVASAHNLGQAKLSTQTLRQFHFLIWNTAIGYFKQSEYQRAIEWLVRCNRLLGPEDNENRAQCLR